MKGPSLRLQGEAGWNSLTLLPPPPVVAAGDEPVYMGGARFVGLKFCDY